MSEYKFDAARWCDSMKKVHFANKDFATAENFKRTRMRIEELEAELDALSARHNALKDAARLEEALKELLDYTRACEGLLNSTESGVCVKARRALEEK